MNGANPPRLDGRRILVVEDEYVIAMEIADVLADFGAVIIGPAGSVEEALGLVSQEGPVDAAVLDVNLGGQKVFPVAEALDARAVPYLFATGYDASVLEAFPQPPRLEKPADPRVIAATLGRLLNGDGV
jgi:CheY-like chemotaxis protein